MRLPSKTKTNIQRRKLLRQLLWSLCLVAPGSLLAANEGQDAKVNSEAPKLTLPSFPAPVAAKTAATPASPESKPVTKQTTGLPTLPAVVAVPSEGTSSQNATKLAPAKDAVIISMPKASGGTGSEQQEKKALATAPPTPTTSGLEKSGRVSVRFGDSAGVEATSHSNQRSEKSSHISANSRTPNPTSFRLSDKDAGAPSPIVAPPAATKPPIMMNMMVAPKAAPQEVVKTETANSGQKSAERAPGAPVLLQATPIRALPAVPNGLTSQPDEALVKNVAPIKIAPIKIAAPENATAENAITESTITENAITQLTVEPKKSSVKLSDSEQIEERVDIASAAANTPAKSVILRPKPVILVQKPAAVVEKKADIAQVPTPQNPAVPLVAATSPAEAGLVLPVMPVPTAVAVAPAKPSTTPQKVASASGSRAVVKMKEVDSKVSPLPPSQVTEGQVAVKAIDPVSPISEPDAKDVASSRTAEVASTAAAPLVLPVMPQPVVSEPVLSELAPLALIPSVPVPPLLAATGPAVQGVSTNATGKPLAISNLAGEEAGLVVAAEENLSAVSVASSQSDAKAVSPKRYTKPADRMIQVGTVALTTMRVGENDVVKCEVDDTSICRAIVTADGSVAFLPGKVGVARATLWVKDPTGAAKVETADIQVGEILPVDQAESVEIGKLNESLQRLYPNTTLQVVASDRCIEIRGEADTEQQAREVLQLVRKLCLVPVKDKVVVR